MNEDSTQRPGYFITDNDYIDSGCHAALCRYSLPAATILPILKRYKRQKTGWSYPSFKQLVIISGLNPKTVSKATATLKKFRLIEKKRAGKRFHFRMNYRVINYDRIGYEKVAGLITVSWKQRYGGLRYHHQMVIKTKSGKLWKKVSLSPSGGDKDEEGVSLSPFHGCEALSPSGGDTKIKNTIKTRNIREKEKTTKLSSLTEEERKIIEQAEAKRLSLIRQAEPEKKKFHLGEKNE